MNSEFKQVHKLAKEIKKISAFCDDSLAYKNLNKTDEFVVQKTLTQILFDLKLVVSQLEPLKKYIGEKQ